MSASFVLSVAVAAVVGGVAAYLGSLMITRRMALVGDALGHVAFPGMGVALLIGVDPSFGAFAFLLLGILAVWKLSEASALSTETVVGIIFVTSLALGFLIVPQPELLESLLGDISKITREGAVFSILICAIVALGVQRIYSGMMLLNISEDIAEVEGVSAAKYNFVYLLSIALIVSVGIKVTGSLLVGALVIVPPAAARMISSNLKQYARNSASIGVLSSVTGTLVSRVVHLSAGPSIILASSVFFLLAFVWQ